MRKQWQKRVVAIGCVVNLSLMSVLQISATETTGTELELETLQETETAQETLFSAQEVQTVESSSIEEMTEIESVPEESETWTAAESEETEISSEQLMETQTEEVQTETASTEEELDLSESLQPSTEEQTQQSTVPQLEEQFGVVGELSEEPLYNAGTEKTIEVSSDRVLYGQSEARTILNMINEMRTSSTDAWYWNSDDKSKTICSDLKPLVYDYTLEKIAMKRAYEIALAYSHTRPNGERCFTAFDDFGIAGVCFAMGENIAAGNGGYTTAEGVNAGWREDNQKYAGQGHRRSMLNSYYNCVGIGHVYFEGVHYWVEEFAYNLSLNTSYVAPTDGYAASSTEVLASKVVINNLALNSSTYNLKLNEKTDRSCSYEVSIDGHWPSYVKTLPVSIFEPTIYTIADLSIAGFSEDKNGNYIQGLKEGNTTVTVAVNGYTATSTVKVHDCNKHWDAGTITKTPTCTQTGVKSYSCQICQSTKTQTLPIDANNHDYSTSWTIDVEGNCYKEGSKSHHCTRCGKKKDITAIPDGHIWDAGTITKEASCTKDGERTYICSRCKGVLTEQIAKLGHDYSDEWTIDRQPGWQKTGYKSHHCRRCNSRTDITELKLSGLTNIKGNVWYYLKDSEIDSSYNGLIFYYGTWYYIEKGVLNWKHTGLTNYYGTWYYVEKGVLNWKYTGLTNYYGTWYYIENGVLNWKYTGLTNYYGTWYYIESGVLNWKYTGLTNYYGTWYYIEKGVLNWKYTGLTNYYGTWYYVEKGKLNWGYTGSVSFNGKIWQVKNGVIILQNK